MEKEIGNLTASHPGSRPPWPLLESTLDRVRRCFPKGDVTLFPGRCVALAHHPHGQEAAGRGVRTFLPAGGQASRQETMCRDTVANNDQLWPRWASSSQSYWGRLTILFWEKLQLQGGM